MRANTAEDGSDMRVLKVAWIIAVGIYVPLMLLYLGVIAPEYLACVACDGEGAMGTDIWGDPVQCFGDSKAFGQVLFELSTVIIVGLSVVLSVLFLWRKLKGNK